MEKCVRIFIWHLAAILLSLPAEGQSLVWAHPSDIIAIHEKLARDFNSGNTNTFAILYVDWFSHMGVPDSEVYKVHFFMLRASGLAAVGESSMSNHAETHTLSTTNLQLLAAALAKLPERSTGTLPFERQILVSGIRSNKWFHAVYDRAKMPKELADLCRLGGARLEVLEK
jgi:hypothetical protein